MANADRMFQVIVLGGIALATPLVGTIAGCGSSSSSFPAEGPRDAGRQDAQTQDTGFPVEGQAAFDSGPRGDAAKDSASADSGFPVEG
jgi:hypothetical protein